MDRSLGKDFYRTDTKAKQRHYLIGYSINRCSVVKVELVVCDGFFLNFIFLDTRHL